MRHPDFMTEFAVQSMERVAEVAGDFEAAEMKELILSFVMAFLMAVPAIGSAAEAIGWATIGRIIALTGHLGNAALIAYGIVEDPDSAVTQVLVALMPVRGSGGFSKAAKIRRGMSAKESAALSSFFQDKSKVLRSLERSCF